MTAESGVEARTFARVDVEIPIRVRALGDDEAEALAKRIASEPTYSESASVESLLKNDEEATWERHAFASILARIDQLESTLARIAVAVGAEQVDDEGWIAGESVNISGSGLGVRIPQRLDEDTPIEVELTLLGDPTVVVRGIGRIASVVDPDGDSLPVGRYHLGVALVAMNDEDREALVKHTFRVQRAQLRERRDADE